MVGGGTTSTHIQKETTDPGAETYGVLGVIIVQQICFKKTKYVSEMHAQKCKYNMKLITIIQIITPNTP